MIDIQFVRDNPEVVAEKSKQKGYAVDVPKLLALDAQRRELLTEVETLRAQRNELAATLKQGRPSPEQIEQGKALKEKVAVLESELEPIEKEFAALLKAAPNMPLNDVPVGASEDENVISKVVGEPTQFDFTPKTHAELGEQRDLIDKERAAKVAGARFAYVKGDLVRLHFAMNLWAMNVLTSEETLKKIAADAGLSNVSTKPFVPVLPPAMARTEVYEATGRLNGEEQTYKLADDNLWLNASAEHTLCPMYMNEVLPEDVLPLRYVGYTTAFRREAGTYGKDMEGIFRLHQFDKLEMESFSTPEQGLDEHLLMIAIQEYLMQQLGLPYRVVTKCTADIGKPNARGVDIDCWLPGQNKYRETHTADYITDFQARGLKTRLKRKNGQLEFVHTNDATALAQRPLIAIIENNQTADGKIIIPEVLRPFLGNQSEI